MSPDRTDDAIVQLCSRWLARHIGNAELAAELAPVDVQELRQGLGFGVEALAVALGLGERTTSDIERLAGGGMSGFGEGISKGSGFRK